MQAPLQLSHFCRVMASRVVEKSPQEQAGQGESMGGWRSQVIRCLFYRLSLLPMLPCPRLPLLQPMSHCPRQASDLDFGLQTPPPDVCAAELGLETIGIWSLAGMKHIYFEDCQRMPSFFGPLRVHNRPSSLRFLGYD